MGFDDVFEVSAAAELVSEATRAYLTEHEEQLPLISTVRPSVVRLIRVRFPNLIPHLLPFKSAGGGGSGPGGETGYGKDRTSQRISASVLSRRVRPR